MKPAKVGAAVSPAVASWQQPIITTNSSQIPLPLRRGSSKSDRSQESDTADVDSISKDRRSSSSRRSSSDRASKPSSSILGSTSFCCASGQKDDNVSETRVPVRPPKKKAAKNSSKTDPERNGTEATPSTAKKGNANSPKSCKNAKTESDAVKERSRDKSRHIVDSPSTRHSVPSSSANTVLPSPSKRMFRPNGNRITETRKSALESRSSQENNGEFEKGSNVVNTEFIRDSKYTDVIREIQKDPGNSLANNLMSSTVESNKLYGKVTNVVGIRCKSDDVRIVNGAVDITATSPGGTIAVGSDNKTVNTMNATTEIADVKMNNLDEQHQESAELKDCLMVKSCDAEELDCPCCENTSQPITEELFVQKECDKLNRLSTPSDWLKCSADVIGDSTKDNKIRDLEDEVLNLRQELVSEREKLKNHQQRIVELENEAKTVDQLKQDLLEERMHRNEAEKKILLLVNESVGNESTPFFTRNTLIDENSENVGKDGELSPLFIGYESRIRRYQAYITKLENDNRMLVTEIKKLRDLSPCSQGEQAKLLLVKLGQLERDNQQQQMEYESCLDDVANKLVHTLLRQKTLEEECQMLHLRVEQLELENSELLRELDNGDRNDVRFVEPQNNPNFTIIAENRKFAESEQLREDNPCSLRSDEDDAMESASVSANVPAETPVGNSPGEKSPSASRIPAFGISKTSPCRKRSKVETPNFSPLKQRNQRAQDTPKASVSPTSRAASSSSANSPKSDFFSKESNFESGENKFVGAKRKRASVIHGNISSENCSKDPKSPSKSHHHVRWDTKVKRPLSLEMGSECHFSSPNTKAADVLTCLKPEDRPQQIQEIWNFTFTVDRMPITSSIKCSSWDNSEVKDPELPPDDKVHGDSEKSLSPSRELETSISIDGIHRTRDEGYSTMSSDQQQDSAADTTVSEHEEPSATYMPMQSGSSSKFISDDSVTECLDGSMTSSSDSGFGPLQQIASSKHIQLFSTPTSIVNRKISDSSASGATSPATIPLVERSDVFNHDKDENVDAPSETITTRPSPSSRMSNGCPFFGNSSKILDDSSACTDSNFPSSQPSTNIHKSTNSSNDRDSSVTNIYSSPAAHNICDEYNLTLPSQHRIMCPEVMTAQSKEHQEQEERIETAEKATLTEPEEAMWREKALAHFIDESIWSLYSSESDTQVRFLSTSASREVSPFDNRDVAVIGRDSTPKIVIIPNDELQNSGLDEVISSPENSAQKTTVLSSIFQNGDVKEGVFGTDVDSERVFHTSGRGLERVASDSVLCLKDAVHELEDSMRPSLRMARIFNTSTNIPFSNHFSASDIRTLDVQCKKSPVASPEILLNLEKTMLQTTYAWHSSVNPSGSSSVCSLQSSNSYHQDQISDETDDVDAMRQPSRKGSQDPDLNSASDAEYENLEHKHFVERWIQKEINQRKSPISTHHDPEGNGIKEAVRTRSPKRRGINLQSDAVATLSALKILSAKCASLANGDLNDSEEDKKGGNGSPLLCPKFPKNFPNEYPEEQSCGSSTSSLVYPIIFTCENVEDDEDGCDEPNFRELEIDLELLDADLKEFNGEFYKLCNVGSSSQSLDHSVPIVIGKVDRNIPEIFVPSSQKPYSQPPPPKMCRLPKRQVSPTKRSTKQNETCLPTMDTPPKPTGYVKPMRPVTLTFGDVPNVKTFNNNNGIKTNCQAVKPLESKLFRLPKPNISSSPTKSSPQKDVNMKMPTQVHSRRSCESSCLPLNQNHTKSSSTNDARNSCRDRSKRNVVRGSAKESPDDLKSSECLPNTKEVAQQQQQPSSPSKRYKVSSPAAGKQSSIISRSELQQERQGGAVSKRHWRGARERRSSSKNAQDASKEGCGTAWIHLGYDPSLSDPKVRASYLDSMAETVSSSGGSSSDECEDNNNPLNTAVQSSSHLQRLCRERRQRIKASRGEDFISSSPRHRVSVLNQHSLYFRFGDQEKEAISCFDFLEDIATSSGSSSEPGSAEANFHKRLMPPPSELESSIGSCRSSCTKERVNLISPCVSEANFAAGIECGRSRTSSFSSKQLRAPVLWNKPLSHNMSSSTINSQDYEILDHISLSDSCAESYSSTPDSFEDGS